MQDQDVDDQKLPIFEEQQLNNPKQQKPSINEGQLVNINQQNINIPIPEEQKLNIFEEQQNINIPQEEKLEIIDEEKQKFKKEINLIESNHSGLSKPPRQRKKYQRINRTILNQVRKRFQNYNNIIQKDQKYTKNGQSLRKIAIHLNISYSLLIQLWQKWNDDSTLMNYSFNTKHLTFRGKSKKTEYRRELLESILAESRLLTRKEIATEIMARQKQIAFKKGKVVQTSQEAPANGRRRYSKSMNQDAVGRLLKQYGYRRKRIKSVPINRNNPQNIQKRLLYCVSLKQMISKNEQICYLDQSILSLDIKRQFGWGKKGEEISLESHSNNGKGVSLVAIICKSGVNQYQTRIGNHSNQSYTELITRLLIKIRAKTNENPKYLIMDESRILNKPEVQKIAKQFNFTLMFLPPCSPQLNPVQSWFCLVKSRVKKETFATENQLMSIVQKICTSFTNESVSVFYQGIAKYIDLGISKVAF